jgi:glucose/arabinose dehydrogenase
MKRIIAKSALTAAIILILFSACGTIPSDLAMSRWSDQTELSIEPEVLLDGLNRPWSMAWLPDGRMLMTERGGRLWLLSASGSDPTEVGGVPPVFSSGQGGLLDVSVGPEEGGLRWIYLAYAAGDEEANRTEVSRFLLDESGAAPVLADAELVFANNEYKTGNQHFGSRIAWLPDGTMLIAIGDGGNPPLRFGDGLQREQAQEPTTLFGNVVRINPDGSVPEDNPFLDRQGYRPELYSIGNRNIQGLAYDAASGRVWATEHGSRGGDEVNIIAAGANYGWPLVSHSREYVRGTPVSRFQTLEGYADPQLVWLDTVAPSGLAVDGDTLYAGGLRSQSVHVISVDEGGEFVGESVIPIGQRVRDVRIGPDGRLWVLTDDAENGRLLRMDRP